MMQMPKRHTNYPILLIPFYHSVRSFALAVDLLLLNAESGPPVNTMRLCVSQQPIIAPKLPLFFFLLLLIFYFSNAPGAIASTTIKLATISPPATVATIRMLPLDAGNLPLIT